MHVEFNDVELLVVDSIDAELLDVAIVVVLDLDVLDLDVDVDDPLDLDVLDVDVEDAVENRLESLDLMFLCLNLTLLTCSRNALVGS